jgi:PAS domain S-box-containing protein
MIVQLANKNQFIETVMANLTIGIAVNEIDSGKTLYMNKAFEEIYGWSKDILTSVDAFFNNVYPDPKIREIIKNKIMADIQSGDISRMKWSDIEIIKSTGEKRYVDARNIPLLRQNLMVSTVIDVTDLKKDKDLNKSHTEELERLNNLMTGRELKMVELKKEIEKLKKQFSKKDKQEYA